MITVENVMTEAKKLPKNGMNPVISWADRDVCCYTKTNQDGSKSHCIAGQILLNLGLSLPDEGSRFNTASVHELYDEDGMGILEPKALQVLSYIQSYADTLSTGYPESERVWGDAVKATAERLEQGAWQS